MAFENAEIVLSLFLTLVVYQVYWSAFLKTADDIAGGGVMILVVRLFGAVLFGVASVAVFTSFT